MMADWTIACILRNAALAGWTAERWPAVAAWVARLHALPAFQATIRAEQIILTTRRAELRDALAAIGVRLTEESYGGREPTPSVMGFG